MGTCCSTADATNPNRLSRNVESKLTIIHENKECEDKKTPYVEGSNTELPPDLFKNSDTHPSVKFECENHNMINNNDMTHNKQHTEYSFTRSDTVKIHSEYEYNETSITSVHSTSETIDSQSLKCIKYLSDNHILRDESVFTRSATMKINLDCESIEEEESSYETGTATELSPSTTISSSSLDTNSLDVLTDVDKSIDARLLNIDDQSANYSNSIDDRLLDIDDQTIPTITVTINNATSFNSVSDMLMN
eukprot:92753_1